MERKLLSLSDLEGINRTTKVSSDKADMKSKRHSTPVIYCCITNHPKLRAIIVLSNLTILRVRSSDRAAVGKAHVCSTMFGASAGKSVGGIEVIQMFGH